MNITVKEASLLTGWSENYIRSACRRQIIGDGFCNGSGKRFTCIVSPGKLSAFMGITTEELENAVREMRSKDI